VADYSATAAFEVLGYVWDKIDAAGVLNQADYYLDDLDITLMPFIPAQEQPETHNLLGDKPYIVYTVYTEQDPDLWAILNDEITMTIFCPDFNKIMEIGNFMLDLFRRMDESARDLNTHITAASKFTFFSTEVGGFIASGESENEGGRQTADLILSYKYSRKLDSSGRYT